MTMFHLFFLASASAPAITFFACDEPAPQIAYFWPGCVVVRVHAACLDALATGAAEVTRAPRLRCAAWRAKDWRVARLCGRLTPEVFPLEWDPWRAGIPPNPERGPSDDRPVYQP